MYGVVVNEESLSMCKDCSAHLQVMLAKHRDHILGSGFWILDFLGQTRDKEFIGHPLK